MQLKTIRKEDRRSAALYSQSFPYHEQREKNSQQRIMGNEEYNYSVIYEEDEFIGLVLYWETDSFIYIEHLCIAEEKRGKGYGHRVLELLKQKAKNMILEIDPPVDEKSIRRKSFYEDIGFKANSYDHIHPPYHKGFEGHRLVLMTWPQQLTEEAYQEFRKYLEEIVMADVC